MHHTKRRILCVDDNEDTCWRLTILLGKAGYEVKSASSVSEGLRLAASEYFDRYILDARFADGTGYDLCREIRAFHRTTPIVFFTGLAHASERQRGLDAGAQDYLIKPGVLSELVETVTRLICDKGRVAASATRTQRLTGVSHTDEQFNVV